MKRFMIFTILLSLAVSGTAMAQLSGAYTVGGDSPDFATPQEAADSLMAQGVSGPVEILIRPGVYEGGTDGDGPVLFIDRKIPGSDGTNRVAFGADRSAGGDTSNVVLQRRVGGRVVRIATSAGQLTPSHITLDSFAAVVKDTLADVRELDPVVDLVGARARFEDIEVIGLKIDGSGRRASVGIRALNCTNDIQIVGNRLIGTAQAVRLDCFSGSEFRFQQNLVEGSGYTLGGCCPVFLSVIDLTLQSTVNPVVSDNVVDMTGQCGHSALNVTGADMFNARVERNHVISHTCGGGDGSGVGGSIRVNGAQGYTVVANNMVSVGTAGTLFRDGGSSVTLHQARDSMLVAHNTVYAYNQARGPRIEADQPNGAHVKILNNIFVADNQQALDPRGSFTRDYNVLSNGTDLGPHSIIKLPEFEDHARDLHLVGASLGDTDLIGLVLDAVSTDFDGDPRSPDLPYIGADEAEAFPEGQPVARDDLFKVFEDSTTTLDVLFNDFDPDAQPMQITTLSTAGLLGEVVVTPDGMAVDYTPPIAFVGRDRFGYTIRDADGLPESALVTVDVVAKPADLVVADVTVPPDVFSGQSLTVQFIVRNLGPGATKAPQWRDHVILSRNSDGSEAVTQRDVQNPTFLDAGEEYTREAVLQVPNGVSGPHFVVVKTDRFNRQPESNETNNTRTSPSTVEVNLTPPPDLRVTAVSIPSNAFSGTSIDASYTVANEGTGPTVGDKWQDVVLGSSSNDVLSAQVLATANRSGALDAGASYNNAIGVSLPNAISGTYFVWVETDRPSQIFEHLLEGNNREQDSISVTLSPPPDLVPAIVQIPPSALSGQEIGVSWTVQNDGAGTPFEPRWTDRIYLSTDPTLEVESDLLLGSSRIAQAVAPGSNYNGSGSFRLRDGLSGTFYAFLVSDANGEVFEHTFEDNNTVVSASTIEISVAPSPDLVVTSVTAPSEATAGGKAFLAWSVSNVGDAALGGRWTDRVYLSSNATFDKPTATEVASRVCNPCSYPMGGTYSTGIEVTLDVDLAAGQHYFHVVADAENSIYEHEAEMNNSGSSATVAISAYPPVDLVVASLSVGSDSVFAGSAVPVNFSVRNAGTAPTLSSRWTDRVYLSADGALDDQDIELLAPTRSQILGGGRSYDRALQAAIPDGINGSFFLLARADDAEQVAEENEDNNVSVSEVIQIVSLPPPDLRVINVSAPADGSAGQPIVVSWTVQNQGTGPTVDDGWFDGIFLSDVQVLTSDARRIGTREHRGGLGVDSTYTDSTEVVIPAYASGAQFLLLKTDSGDGVFEGTREGNNVVSAPLIITLDEPSDLVVEDVVAPAAAVPGEEVTVSYSVRNVGPNRAAGTVVDGVYASTDGTWDVDDHLVALVSQRIDLAPGASQKMFAKVDVGRTIQTDVSGNVTADLPGLLPGDYELLVRTDVRNAIRETDNENNTTIAPAATAVSIEELLLDAQATFSLIRGQRKYYALTVGAGEDIRLTLTSDDVAAANDIYVAFERVPGPSDFDFGTPVPNAADHELFVPTTQAGTYYVMVEGRDVPAGTEQMSLLAEALGFTILSITPDEGGAGGRLTTTIRGAGFRGQTEFFLDRAGSSVAATQTKILASTQAVVRWNLADTLSGQYDMVARRGADESRLVETFRIVRAVPLRLTATTSVPDDVRVGRGAAFTLSLKNEGNTDIPYFLVRIDLPKDVHVDSVDPDSILVTRSIKLRRLRPLFGQGKTEAYTDSLNIFFDQPDFFVVKDDFGAAINLAVDLEGRDLVVGGVATVRIEITGVSEDELFFGGIATPLSGTEYVDYLVEFAESARAELLDIGFDMQDPRVRDANNFLASVLNVFEEIGLLDPQDAAYGRSLDVSGSWVGKLVGSGQAITNALASTGFTELRFNESYCNLNYWSSQVCEGGAISLCILGVARAAPALGRFAARPELNTGIATGEASSGIGGGAGGAALALGPIIGRVCPVGLLCDIALKPEHPDYQHCYVPSRSADPNDILGPAGFGDDRWIPIDDPLRYTIRFENDPVKATAAAQEVFVTQQLDSTLDWRSFRLGEFGFGEWRFQVPDNVAFYQTRLDVRDSLNLFVDFTAGIDITTGEAFWRFESIDPLTGELPWFDGFLPPNDTLGRGTGEGFVTYTIKPIATAKTRDIVNAEAKIIFDVNEPIDTPPIFNTIDAEPPVSMVQPLAALTDTSNFPVTWSLDDFGGSDAREFTLYASMNGGPFEVYRSGIADTSAIFVGEYDTDYSFYVVATDNTGQAESLKSAGEASTATVRPVGLEADELPKEFALYQNYPNPFNPTTTIPFDIAKAGDVEITVYDVIGRRVLRADQGSLTAGRYRAAFNLSHLASGVYVYRIQVRGGERKLFEATNKFVLVK